MKRALLLGLALGFGLALVASPGTANATNPAGEFTLLMRLNGSPVFAGHTSPGIDAGTTDRVDGGLGNIIKTQCYQAACVCPGTSCSCGNVHASSGASYFTNGEYIAANGVVYTVLTPTNGMVTTAYATGSTRFDGGVGAECDHWRL